MKISIYILMVVLCTVNMNLKAQNKSIEKFKLIAKEKDLYIQALAEKYNINIETSTIPIEIFASWTTFGHIIMIKDAGNYYAVFQYYVLPIDSLDQKHNLSMLMKNGDNILLSPYSKRFNRIASGSNTFYSPTGHIEVSSTGKIGNSLMATNISYSNSVDYYLYKISSEQMQCMSVNDIKFISLHLNSFKEIKKNKHAKIDQQGNTILEYTANPPFAGWVKDVCQYFLSY